MPLIDQIRPLSELLVDSIKPDINLNKQVKKQKGHKSTFK